MVNDPATITAIIAARIFTRAKASVIELTLGRLAEPQFEQDQTPLYPIIESRSVTILVEPSPWTGESSSRRG
jgi:hypothetical protein